MELKYKLKKEARQFFKKDWHTDILTSDRWKKRSIPTELLDEVEKVYLSFGISTSDISKTLCGHKGNERESHFEFTVHVADHDWKEYEAVDRGALMDKIQSVLDTYFKRK